MGLSLTHRALSENTLGASKTWNRASQQPPSRSCLCRFEGRELCWRKYLHNWDVWWFTLESKWDNYGHTSARPPGQRQPSPHPGAWLAVAPCVWVPQEWGEAGCLPRLPPALPGGETLTLTNRRHAHLAGMRRDGRGRTPRCLWGRPHPGRHCQLLASTAICSECPAGGWRTPDLHLELFYCRFTGDKAQGAALLGCRHKTKQTKERGEKNPSHI